MNVLIWHVHGSWMTNFVSGEQTYLLPCVADRGPDGRGRAETWTWPSNAIEVSPDQLATAEIDVVVIQNPRELELAGRWLGGRRLGSDLPVIWLEHNAPQGRIDEMRHPAADRGDIIVVHVTHTNALLWDTGSTPTVVIEHGVRDPGHLWTGEEAVTGVVVNEPVRRGRVVGTDLLPRLGSAAPVDVFGMDVTSLPKFFGDPDWLRVYENVPQRRLHELLALRRCYVHPYRWTSLGLALIEAMLLGLPVVALATTDAPAAVPPHCGVVSNDLSAFTGAAARMVGDHGMATELGHGAREHALGRYGIERFLNEWNQVLEGARS